MTIDARPTATIPFKKNFDESLINNILNMTRKEQNKILDDKIKSNVNQYKVDRLNAEISAFSIGDLNKYEFLTRKDLDYKPNALYKMRFEFSPLGKAFSTGLDKTAEGYQEGVIKILRDIRDDLANGVIRPKHMLNRPNDDMMMMMMVMMMMMMIDQIDQIDPMIDPMIDQIDLIIDQIGLMELLIVCF